MNKFIAQLKNDFNINMKSLLNPVIVLIILDILAIITFFILKSKIGFEYNDIVSVQIDADEVGMSQIRNSMWYLIGIAVPGIAGFVMVIVSLSIGNHALNLEKFRKCEIFYRSQPISIWLYSLSKYLIAVAGPIVVLIAISIFNLLLVIPFINQIIRFDLIDAISGLIVSILLYSRSIIVVGSLGFMLSGIFKERAFLKLILILISIQLIIVFAHFSLDTPLYDIMKYLVNLINPLHGLKDMINTDNLETVIDFRQAFNPGVILFNWHSALQIIASGVFFILGIFAYSRKEVN